MDRAFVESLFELNYHSIATNIGYVNNKFGLIMSWEDAVARRHFFEDHFDTFNDVINTPNIHFDILKNTILGDDKTWRNLMKVSF